MASIMVHPATLRWAVSQSGADPAAVARKEGLSDFPQWLNAVDPFSLSFSKLTALGSALQMPFGALVRSVVPEAHEDELIRYRTIDNHAVDASRNLKDTIAIMRNRQNWAHDEMLAQGFGNNLLVGSVSSRATADEMALRLREGLSLDAGWCRHKRNAERFRFLREKASDAGLMVMVDSKAGTSNARRLDVREFRAFVLLDDVAPLIFINRNDSYAAMLFSLLHEIGHVLLGTNEVYNDLFLTADDGEIERRINQAVVLSVVDDDAEFREYWEKIATGGASVCEIANDCAKRYGLSALALTIHAHRLGIVGDKAVNLVRAASDVRVIGAKAGSGGDQNLTNASHLDTRFVRMIRDGVDRGSLPYSDGLTLLGVKSMHAYDGLLKAKGLDQ
ncbi:ImmA/IrrE family metallo-endopeptidase [Bifidobacterium vespertilionis]|uniref:ImmA/IrrE family metallo-endopeptidase n=1 Tax=Bifidobacterium vespertilionis TaxID=2562524 RepID=A0A5J5DVB5_9BIFI|nr:ImmA/IrrE family metallo-endopeptidase [Bifidobacterium vespertilionis]KAA8820764.1 ImmA/IrrE family metallo-endopeptidase [Bifidobacterium vespertilionis]KAA8821053.1 ImmA/IrrE family metallo-endopeptidase [Bifidobacterium vespertilionis]